MSQNSDFTGIFIFKSPAAAKLFQIACLGFLGVLGLVPGWERLFGFTGFFGFFGAACLVEGIHRLKHRD